MIGASIMPPTTTTASGFCTCEPMPDSADDETNHHPIAVTRWQILGHAMFIGV
jgi:hypothetical protein